MDEGSSKFTLLFFLAAAATLALLRLVPVLTSGFVGVGISIPQWALRVSPDNPLRAMALAAAAALGIAATIAALVRRAIYTK